jgi:hypothetical protein
MLVLLLRVARPLAVVQLSVGECTAVYCSVLRVQKQGCSSQQPVLLTSSMGSLVLYRMLTACSMLLMKVCGAVQRGVSITYITTVGKPLANKSAVGIKQQHTIVSDCAAWRVYHVHHHGGEAARKQACGMQTGQQWVEREQTEHGW